MDAAGMSSSGKSSSYYAAMSALLKASLNAGGGGSTGGGGGGGGGSSTGGGGDSSSRDRDRSSSSAQHRPKFVIPVPPVPREIRNMVKEQSHSKEKAAIHQLNAKLMEERQRARDLEAEIAELEQSKLDAIRRVEAESERDTKLACEAIEKELRSQYELDKKRRREEWRRQIEEECERDFQGSGSEKADAVPLKRSRPEVEAKEDDPAAEAAQSDRDGVISAKREGDAEVPEGKDDSSVQQQEPHEALPTAVAAAPLPPSESLLAAEANEKAATSRLTAQQELLQEAQQNVDKLQEKRGEIVWLLKQVIKAEAKAKALRQQQANQDAK